MAITKAIQSGKWSESSTWDFNIIPSFSDEVYANNYTIEIDQNINVGSLNTIATGTYAIAGGGFVIYTPLCAVATNDEGVVSGSTTCLTVSLSTRGTVNLIGNCKAGTVSGAGISNEPTSRGDIIMIGNLSGSNLGSDTNGMLHSGKGTVEIIGNVVPRSNGSGIRIDSNDSHLKITGNIYADSTLGVLGVPGVTSGYASTVIIDGNIINSSNGNQALHLKKVQMVDDQKSYRFTDIYNSAGIKTVLYNAVTPSSLQPPVSAVRAGVDYAEWPTYNISAQLAGTMVIPDVKNVAIGRPVGDLYGITPISFVESPSNTISIGDKIQFLNLSTYSTILTGVEYTVTSTHSPFNIEFNKGGATPNEVLNGQSIVSHVTTLSTNTGLKAVALSAGNVTHLIYATYSTPPRLFIDVPIQSTNYNKNLIGDRLNKLATTQQFGNETLKLN